MDVSLRANASSRRLRGNSGPRAEAPTDNQWSLSSVWLAEPFDGGDSLAVVTVDLNAYASANSLDVATLVPWWTNLTAPSGYRAGWEPCVYLGNGIYALWYDRPTRPSWFPLNGANIGISVRPAGFSRSLVSTTRKGPVVLATEPIAQPANEVPPSLSGAPVVGATISVIPGEWTDAGIITTELRVNGAVVAQPYTILATDDGATIQAREIAISGPYQVEAASAVQTVTFAVPVFTAGLADVFVTVGDPAPTRDAGAILTGAGGTWSVTGPGASVNSSGVVTIDTTTAASGIVTVSYTNSGGAAVSSFNIEVTPANATATWTPADIDPAVTFFAIYTFRSADVTVNGSNHITAITPRYSRGGTFTMSFDSGAFPTITSPAPWDAANEALDFGAGVGSVAHLTLPFTYLVRNTNGTPGPTGGAAIAIAGTGMDGTYLGVPRTGILFANPSAANADGRPTAGIRGVARTLGTNAPIAGYPTAAATIFQASSTGQTGGTTLTFDGRRRQSNPNNLQAQASTTTFLIGALPNLSQANGVEGMAGKVRLMAVFSRPLSSVDRLRFDSWIKFNVAGMSGVTLYDYDTVDGTAGTPVLSALNDAEYVSGSPPISTGNPLTDVAGNVITSLYAGVAIEPIRVKPLFFFGDTYQVTGLPPGLTMTNGVITGTPTTPGTFAAVQITATNSTGSLARTFSITVAAAPATVTTETEMWAAAFGGTSGGTLTIDNLGTLIGDPTVLKASAIAGATVTLVGATDFRAGTLPTTNLDAEFRRHIPHRDSTGLPSAAAPVEPAHLLFSDDARLRRFGPENVYVAPMDHGQIDGQWVPLGLKLHDDDPDEMGAVAVRHRHEHDGHVLWAMKVRRADGTIETVYEEMDNTRAKNPRPTFRAALRAGSPVTHLLSLATFQIASHAAMTVNAVEDSADPRTWVLPAKRRRGDYTVDATATDWADVSTKIAALTIMGGQITGKASGARYVIQLPATVLKNGTANAHARLSSAARTKLTEIRAQTDNWVFLVGVPGKTVLPWFWAEPGTRLEIGWVTFARDVVEAFGGADRTNMLLVDIDAHVRCFGCVVDGLDGTAAVGGADRADMPNKPSIFEFYDGMISGVYNGAGGGTATDNTAGLTEAEFDSAQARMFIARSILAHGNDDTAITGAFSTRFEGNYLLGGGGTSSADQGLFHRDIGAQTFGQGRGKINVAHYNNIFHSGPAQYSRFANRAAETLYMLQAARMDVFDVVGNVYLLLGQKMQFRGTTRRRPVGADMTTPPDWIYRSGVSGNLFLPYPPLMTAASVSYPELRAEGVAGGNGAHEGWSGSDNLQLLVDYESPAGFARTVNIFPEEVADANRAAWLDAADAFTSFPAISGTYQTGYTADWSGTTYAGTSREGYIAPADIEVAPALRTWGVGGGPNLPQHGAHLANYLDLPADIYQHLGYVDAGGVSLTGGLYPSDWFGKWTPSETTLDATLADPWTPMPGATTVEPKSILFNFKLGATVGEGLLFEEIDADGSKHVLGIDADAKPYWTMYDTNGTTVLYHMKSAVPVEPNSHVFVHPSTRFQAWMVEGSFATIAVQQMIHDHYVRDAQTDELVHFYYAAPTAPFSTNPAAITGVKQVHLWCKTNERNQIYVWNGSAWVWAHGALEQIAANRFNSFVTGLESTDPDVEVSGAGREFRQAMLPTGSRRVIFKQTAPATIGATSPTFTGFVTGDLVWYARDAAETPNGVVVAQYDGTGWVAGSSGTPNTFSVRGEPHCWFRVDGQQSLCDSEWVWSNQDPRMGVQYQNLNVSATSLAFDFLVKDAADIEVASQVWMAVADINSPSGWAAVYTAGARAVDPGDWTIAPGSLDNPAGGTINLEPLALINAHEAFAARPIVTEYDMTAHKFMQDNPGVQLWVRRRTDYRLPEPGELNQIEARVQLRLTEDRYAAYSIDHELPRGSVRLGADTSAPYDEAVRFFEARRFRGTIKKGHTGELEANGVGIWHRLAREPVDPATGERDHPMFGPADVWAWSGIEETSGTVVATVTDDGTDVTVVVSAPPEYAGTHVLTGAVAALATGPVEVVAPVTSSDEASPHPTFTATPGLWLGENGPIVTATEWLIEGAVVGTSSTYTRTADGVGKEIRYRERATDSAGTRTGTFYVAQAAPAFAPATIQFRDSFLLTENGAGSDRPFGPTASMTNKGAVALRVTPVVTNTTSFLAGGLFVLRFNSSGQYRVQASPFGIDSAFNATIGTASSWLATWDGSAAGTTFRVWAKFGSGSVSEILTSTTTWAGPDSPVGSVGSSGAANVGPSFDLQHWIWAHDAAVDATTAWDVFFNADGSVRDLGFDGTADGALPAPKFYMRGNDFLTANNSGTGPDPSAARTAIAVVTP